MRCICNLVCSLYLYPYSIKFPLADVTIWTFLGFFSVSRCADRLTALRHSFSHSLQIDCSQGKTYLLYSICN